MIGPGKALDTDKYFIVCTDAISNGLTTSPAIKAQPRMQFPQFTIRDMVQSQYRLMKEKLGIDQVVAVVGPSMGGMQALQWGVSHPEYMDAWWPWCRWPTRRPGRSRCWRPPQGDHARPRLERWQLRRAAGKRRPPVARHS